ncbi:response regulator transcription factor [Crossiella cryophila]|uniref:DNA-binding NarL/FixJ family response regulator n=1 Tax=Crossiella cryophila TaxID=43355 RepID=A0A7W7CJA9_9PSEU|nr:response regulator transcription factor [Crossiella cryophila]MBB4680494.1 DNA-binding NarL/FixJ family response regulator [Crossiella cryophila]
MTAVAQLRVRLDATDATVRAGALELLSRAGITVDPAEPTVTLAVGGTVEEALDAALTTPEQALPVTEPGRGRRLMVLADTFAPAGVLRAVRTGVSVLLHTRRTTADQLVAAVHSARHGDGRLPSEVLARLLSGPETAVVTAPRTLTARQTAVLTLMADGHGNAAIARSLSCSEHTVKNVIYELMARLQVRNRSHAVARAVRAGLI